MMGEKSHSEWVGGRERERKGAESHEEGEEITQELERERKTGKEKDMEEMCRLNPFSQTVYLSLQLNSVFPEPNLQTQASRGVSNTQNCFKSALEHFPPH